MDEHHHDEPTTPSDPDETADLPAERSSDAILGRGSAANEDEWIGPYRLLDRLGEGGMGVVYLAEQFEPIERRVALKIIKPGMDSEAVVARFEAERQALAKMDHQNIARVLDAGVTARGLPYFVMEYVKGSPITEHADRERLDIEERLDLFIQVCEAVQHAHHKGIIHRDIKPTNILVAWEGQHAIPKVIDFGIARATDQTGSDAAFTRHGQLIGTPEYMSPEQAEMGAQDIDTRTDVYALGVVLYQLLTGVLPFESRTLREAGLDAIRQIIREVDPPRPSRRLRTLPAAGETTLGSVSKARSVDSRRLSRVLRNDLDWVVMKCLEKRRDRRYDTPSALALDLRRFLAGETVLTGPPSLTYHAGKFIRRHRAAVLSVSLISLAVVGGLVATVVQRERAEESERRARALATDLVTVFHDRVLDLPGAIRARRELVEIGSANLEEQRRDAARDLELTLTLANAYDKLGYVAGGIRTPNIGDLDGALEHFEDARALRLRAQREHPEDARVALGLARGGLAIGDVRREQERLDDAVKEYRLALSRLESIPKDAPIETEAGLARVDVQVALAYALARQRDRETIPERLELLVSAERIASDLERPLTSESPDRDRARDALAHALHALGEHYYSVRDVHAAVPYFERASQIRSTLFAADPVNSRLRRELAGSLFRYAEMLGYLGDSQTAESPMRDAGRHFEFLVEADPSDAEARERLSQVYEFRAMRAQAAGNRREAIELVRIAIEHMERVRQGAARNPDTLWILANQERRLARNLADESIAEYEEAVSVVAFAYEHMDQYMRVDPSGIRQLGFAISLRTQALGRLQATGARPASTMTEHWRRYRASLGESRRWIEEESGIDPEHPHVRETLDRIREAMSSCDKGLASLEG